VASTAVPFQPRGVHNLCRHKRQTKAKSADDLKAIRDGQFLPCTYNVPNSVCQNLFCAACTIAKAHCRKASISPSSGKPSKEMVLKEGHVNPGDCVSCDHYLYHQSRALLLPHQATLPAPMGTSPEPFMLTMLQGTSFTAHNGPLLPVTPSVASSSSRRTQQTLG
jgi:hypothetical protein